MAPGHDPYLSLLTEYAAAMAQERAEWKIVSDTSVGAAERAVAYARWRAAAERIKTLAAKLQDAGASPPLPPARPE